MGEISTWEGFYRNVEKSASITAVSVLSSTLQKNKTTTKKHKKEYVYRKINPKYSLKNPKSPKAADPTPLESH